MTRDAYDMFRTPERGRFGENEERPSRPGRGPRVTGASDLVDLDMVLHVDMDRPSAVLASFGDRTTAVWLARSLIEILETGRPERKLRGFIDQKVRITLPRWKAEQSGLV